MSKHKFNVIALDLEGTLISNAVSQIPRPGLYSFLEYCYKNFYRIVVFTAVKELKFREIGRTLAEHKKVPDWFPHIEYINWHGKYKDLTFIPNTKSNKVILIDDREEYIKPEQKDRWIFVPGYDSPYLENDFEFKKVINKLAHIS